MRIESLRPMQRGAILSPAASLVALLWLTAGACRPAAHEPQLTEVERATHLLSRATYGARPEDVDSLLSMGTVAWLDAQLHPSPGEVAPVPPPPGVTVRNPERAVQPSMSEMVDMRTLRLAQVGFLLESRGGIRHTDVMAKLYRAIRSPNQLEEVMTDFWFNHFNVFSGKGEVGQAIADYERTAIRQNVFGRFEDMLAAVARHPAMLIYLDNYVSGAPAGDGASPGAGINENYSRELLELHTLGVDGGYTERDVREVARAFSGWTILPRPRRTDVRLLTGRPLAFAFEREWHDTGSKIVLGHALPAGRGMEDGDDVLLILARHPSTAHHIARKLVRHFVADDPPDAFVDEIATVFTTTAGDLREVTRALFTSDAFYKASHYRNKVKRPFEFVASALRLLGAEPAIAMDPRSPTTGLLRELTALKHVPYGERAPTGHPTTADEWVSAGAMLARMNFALALTEGRYPEAGLDLSSVFRQDASAATSVTSAASNEPGNGAPASIAARVLARILPGLAAPELQPLIAEDLAMYGGTEPHALVGRAAALALGSPAFQRY